MAHNAPITDASIGTILTDLVDNTQTLVRQQVDLVKAEVTETVTAQVQSRVGPIGMLVGAGIFALFSLGFLGVSLIFALQTFLNLTFWLSALIVTLLYLVIAAILGFLGKKGLEAASKSSTPAEEIDPESGGAKVY